MIILFLLLQFKVISEEKIQRCQADFLLGNMGIFFIPAGVSLIQSLGLIKRKCHFTFIMYNTYKYRSYDR